jgi:hypothetical protein
MPRAWEESERNFIVFFKPDAEAGGFVAECPIIPGRLLEGARIPQRQL